MSRISSNHSKRFLDRFRPRSKRQLLQQARRRLFLHRPGMEGLEPRLMLASDLLVADAVTDSILRFDGNTGAPLGAFVTSGSGGLVDPLDPTFGPDGNLYVISNAPGQVKVLRYNGTSGAPLGTFINIGAGSASDIEFGPDGNLYLATISETGVLRFNGTTGAAAGVAASGNGIRRASGIDFGPDGKLYVLDSDRVIDTSADRVLRFDPASGAFIDQFVAPGFLNDAVFLTFGPDNQLYVPDIQQFHDVRRFSGTTGAFNGVFATSPDPANNPIFDIQFGLDGNAYAATGNGILRFDSESGALLGEFVADVGGSITFFPPEGPVTDLAVTDVQPPVGAVQGNDLSITYTVINNSTLATAASSWDDVVYLSTDGVFDPSDQEFGRITRTTGLAGGASYNETLTAQTPSIAFGDYHVFVFADRRGVVNDTARLNNLGRSSTTLEVFPPLASTHDPDHSIAVGRTLSAYTTQDITNGELTITYTVYNLTDGYVQGTLLKTTLGSGVSFVGASQSPNRSGQELAWSLGVIAPFRRISIEVQVVLGSSNAIIPDAGPQAFGMLDTVAVQDSLPPVVLRSDAIDPALLAATLDANSLDPFIQQQAAALDQDPNLIFQFVRDEVHFESYAGSLRGARGALWSRAGNALDQASLLVSLLRSSGIGARYVTGVLDEDLAKELILDMFPLELEIAGALSPDTVLSSPETEPILLDETRAHYWVEYQAGLQTISADPVFSTSSPNQVFTTPVTRFAEVSNALRHRITVQVERELTIPAAGLFGTGSQFNSVSLEASFFSSELVGKTLSVGFFIDSSEANTPIVSAVYHTYTPYFIIGEINGDAAEDDLRVGESIFETITNFPLGNQILTGIFLNLTLASPDGSSEVYDRTLFDRIGLVARKTGGSISLDFAASNGAAIGQFDITTLSFSSSDQSVPSAVGSRLFFDNASSALFNQLAEFGSTSSVIVAPFVSRAVIASQRARISSFLAASESGTAALAKIAGVKAYLDSPRIIITSTRVESNTKSGSKVTFDVDLKKDDIRAIPFPNHGANVTFGYQASRGLLENDLELLILSAPGQRTISAGRIIATALENGDDFTVVVRENLAILQTLQISEIAKLRIFESVTNNKVIIVPSKAVLLDGQSEIAWLEYDPLSGALTCVMENGTHGSLAEWGAKLVADAVRQKDEAFFYGLMAGATGASITSLAISLNFLGINKPYKDAQNGILGEGKGGLLLLGGGGLSALLRKVAAETIAAAELAVKETLFKLFIASPVTFKFALGFTAGFALVFPLAESLVQHFHLADPPLLDGILYNPTPPDVRRENYTQGYLRNVAATVSGGPLNANLQPTTFTLEGTSEVKWINASLSTFQISSLEASLSSISSIEGDLIAQNSDISLVSSDAIEAIAAGEFDITINGVGTSIYHALPNQLVGSSSLWESYEAQLVGASQIQLTTDRLRVAGQFLPLGTYVISTSRASIAGRGNTAYSAFASSLAIFANGATLTVVGTSGTSVVSGLQMNAKDGTTISDYTGTLSFNSSQLVMAGNAANATWIESFPQTLSTDQNTTVTFRVDIATTFPGDYQLSVEGPVGWKVNLTQDGIVSALPASGLQAGTFPIRVIARAKDNPRLVAQAVTNVEILPTQPEVQLSVSRDELYFLPFNGAQLPTVFRANIRNLGPSMDDFLLSASDIIGFEANFPLSRITIPPGETAVVDFYLSPKSDLPAPGTNAAFTVQVVSASNPAVQSIQAIAFTVPEIHGIKIEFQSSSLTSLPGTPLDNQLVVTSTGNVLESVTFDTRLSAGVHVNGLGPVVLDAQAQIIIPVEIQTEPDTPLNSRLLGVITASFNAPETVSTSFNISVAVPGVESINRAVPLIENLAVANRLTDLSIRLTSLVQNPNDLHKSEALASLDSAISLFANDELLSRFVNPLSVSRNVLALSVTSQEIRLAVIALGGALDSLAITIVTLSKSNFELFLLPNSQVALPQSPAQFELRIHNIGTATSKYNVTLQGVPAGVSATLSESQVTLARDQFATVMVTLTQTSLNELLEFGFSLDVSVDGAPQISKSAMGTLTARKEFISVVSMTATPPFNDAGGQVEVAARLLNAVNREQKARASFVVRDASGTQVRGASTPVDVTLTVQTSLVTLPLGSIDTTGLANGNYSIVLTLVDLDGNSIPGGAGSTNFLVGSPLTASIDVTPSVLPPGTNTITNTLKIEALAPLVSPPTLLGQVAAAGSSDVVRNGDFVYVASPSGIQVFDIAGANLQNPQLLRTVGSATSLLEMRGNLLVSVLARPGGGSTTLTTFSLTDPATPTQLGTTGDIPYGTAADLIVTDTHAFVVLVNIIFTLNRDIFDQNGGLIAINISNPAAPFFDGDAVTAKGTPAGRDGVNDGVLFNENGTNNDGIKNPIGIDQSGGNQNTWSIVQVSPTVLLLSGSTATGTDTQNGVGVVRVVDISDPRNMRLLRDLQVPGTVHVFDVAVSGNRGLLTASQGGFADFTQGFPFTGNVVLATLDLSDPANPQIIHQQTLDRSARSVDHATALGSGMFAIANLGGVSDQPGLFIVDASDPNQFGLAGLDVPAGINELVGGNGLIFTTDGASLIVYDVPSKDPLTLIGQVSIPGGLRGVAARNNIAYASGANGIQVIDYTDPQNPVVVGTIPGNHYGAVIQDNVLLALRPAGPSFILDVFALQNTPLAPPLIGSSPVINYNLAAELRSNSTHAFIGQFNVCFFLGSNDIYHQAGDMISLALNLDDPLNPTVATPTLDNVLFNTNGDNQFDPTDVSGCAENGGDHNVFGIALANPQTAYLATTTVTGGDTQAGIGRIQVVDVTVPATAQVIRELDIPGTVVTLGVGVSGNVGVVIGSTQGFQDNPNGVIIGNLTVTTLDVSDPRDPKIVTTRTLDRITSTFWVNFTTLGNGRFAFSNAAFTGNVVDPAVIIIDASNPRSPLIGQSNIPLDLIAPNSLSTDGNFLFTADAAGSLSLYRVNPLPGLPVTARVQIPNGTGVTVVPGSFNIPPADVIAGTDFDTYVFDLTLAPSLPSEMLVWQSVVNGLRPGESRPVTLGTTIDFAFQGTAGQVVLPRTAVAAEQIMSLFPSERSVRPGEEAPFSVVIANPSTLDVSYDLSVSGLPAEWVSLDSSITVPAGGSAVAYLRLTSGAFDVLGDYGFVVNATVAGVNSSVAGTLTLTGTPMLPDVHPDARGVVVSLSPATATVGQGTSATYVARVFNVGSLPDDFVLFVTGLPAGFQTNFNAGIINVPPGSSNFRDVQLTVTAPLGTSAADYPFNVVAASITDVTITGETQGVVSVVPLGVQVDITPAISGPNSTVQMLVTNTGQLAETYDLSLAAPVALVATLGSASVTLQPGESMSIPISIGAIDFAFPGSLMLAGVARSRTNSDVFASDSVDVTILSTSGLTAGFDRPMQQLAAPGAATFLLQVDNLGNLEDEFTATILSTNGPINASLVGLRGETTQTVPIFRLPGLSTGALVLNTNLMSNGAASVIVRVASRTNPQLFSDATATLQSELATTLSLAAANADKLEGDADFTPFTFTVTRGGNLSGATTVNWTTVGSGASPADAGDFGGSFPSGQVSFAPTETTKTLTINVSGDRFIEPDETFSVVLSGASEDATIIASSANGTIRNDDALPAVLRIEATSADKLEGNSGSTVFTFTVTRSGNLSGVTTVDYAVTGGGLIPADEVDFGGSLPSGQLNFAINESSKTISVVVRGDTINELDEKFIVTLSNASGPAIIDVATAAGVIRNDDVESGFRLTCSSLHVGLNTCTVLGATPGGIVNLALGIVPGTKFLPKFGVTLGIQDSSIVAQGIVQPDGRAVVQFTIANEQILQQVLLQAFEQAPTPRTTNIVIVGMPLRAAAGQLGGNEAISNQVLPSLLAAAVARWQATGLSYRESQLLESLTVEIVDLPTGMLGQAVDQRIFVDSTAAGHGWFVDTTPADNAEFAMTGHPAVRNASAAGPAQGRVDLLTVLMHEIGHVLGLGDSANSATSPLMSPTLTDGVRRLPTADAVTRDPLDINRDGLISPLDVLLIINQINLSAVGNAKAESLAFPSEYDINQDGILSALDPLLVINYLNHRAPSSQSGEGESVPRDELFSVPNLFELSATENSTDDELLQALAADAVNTWLNDRRGALFSLR